MITIEKITIFENFGEFFRFSLKVRDIFSVYFNFTKKYSNFQVLHVDEKIKNRYFQKKFSNPLMICNFKKIQNIKIEKISENFQNFMIMITMIIIICSYQNGPHDLITIHDPPSVAVA